MRTIFYKIQIKHMKYITNNSSDNKLCSQINTLLNMKDSKLNSKYFNVNYTYFYIGKVTINNKDEISYNWMRGDRHGYDFYINSHYEYGGDFINIKKLRKLKLKDIQRKLKL